jgi:hypothetical protein
MAKELSLINPASGSPAHLVDQRFIHRPGIQTAFRAVVIVVRSAVETERLGGAIELARGAPCLLRGLLGRRVRAGEEGIDRALHRLGRAQRVLVVGVDQAGVMLDHRGGVHFSGQRRLAAEGGDQSEREDELFHG